MRRTLMMFVSLFALATVAVFFQPKSAQAYPGFARKYNFPCAFCHIQWPKLADTGHFFKDRGFMMSSTGKANGLDMMFEKPGNQNYFPIGFHMSMAYYGSQVQGVATHNNGAGNQAYYAPGSVDPALNNGGGNFVTNSSGSLESNSPSTQGRGGWANGASANTPWDIESGGLLNNWISFWVQPGYNGASGLNIVKLWVRFDDLFNTTWLNIYAGKSSLDAPFSNQRNVYIGTSSPWTMYDFQPGTAEVMNNGGASSAGFNFIGMGALYYDGDMFALNNDATQIRYFGYHINSPTSCMTQKAFSINPCETRLSVSFAPNSSLYGGNSFVSGSGNANGFLAANAGSPSSGNVANNGFNYFAHLTQSFGGWGRTNGERIGVFALVGEGSAMPMGGGTAPATVYNREGVDFMINPIPNGGLNIFGAWEIAQDPTGMIAASPLLPGFNGSNYATNGVEYMTWLVQADWQPTFGGFFSQSGTNSNMISLIYNQLNMMQQPSFTGISALPGNFDNVLAFTLSDRYWLWGSDRADISLFAQYQFMINYGVAGALSAWSSNSGTGTGLVPGVGSNQFFGNVEANNFAVGIDFAY